MTWIKLSEREPAAADYPVWMCKEGDKEPTQFNQRPSSFTVKRVYTYWQSVGIPTPPARPKTREELLWDEALAAMPTDGFTEAEDWCNGYVAGVHAERRVTTALLFPEPCGPADTREEVINEIGKRIGARL